MRLFDIHCHILPGVDDGSRDMDMSMDMLDIAYEEGTRDIILTPHYMLDDISYDYNKLEEIFAELSAKAKERYPNLNLYLGNEVLWENGIMEKLKSGDIHTMNNTKYVLVEFNIRTSYNELCDAMNQLVMARYIPIIAHVERYRCLVDRLDRIEELVNMRVLLQMNISSVEGGFLNEDTRWCRKLLKNDYITFLATDAHNVDSRAPYVNEYLKKLRKKCGEELTQWMLEDAAKIMVEGGRID